jgi:methionine-rich copper-binding protein CopC
MISLAFSWDILGKQTDGASICQPSGQATQGLCRGFPPESRSMTTPSIRHLCRLLMLLAFVLLAMALVVPIARADATYERSEPPADAVVPAAPAAVHVWFTQELFRRAGGNSLEVISPDGTRVDAQDVQLDDDDRTHLFVSLSDNLPAGLYTVRWRTLSADDGHSSEGEFNFTVDAEAVEPAAAPGATPVPTPTTTLEPTEPLSPTVNTTPIPPSQTPAPPGPLPCLGSASLGLASLAPVYTKRSRYLRKK